MCILPSNQKSYYDAIKKYLNSDCPVPSQCVLAQTLSKQGMIMSIATKIALQMACKLGGELWALEIPVRNPHSLPFAHQPISSCVFKMKSK